MDTTLLLPILYSVAATAVAIALLTVFFRGRRFVADKLHDLVTARVEEATGIHVTMSRHMMSIVAIRATNILATFLGVLVLYLWLVFVFEQFAATKALGDNLGFYILDAAKMVGVGILEAIPNLIIVIVVIIITRGVVQLIRFLLDRAAGGTLVIPGLDPELAAPTSRILVVIIWLFAIATIYPLLPGANTDAFRGLSVLLGIMLSFGSSGPVGHAMSGVLLMYSRLVKKGEFVRINDSEGFVTSVGPFFTRLRTAFDEDVALPNAVVLSAHIVNYSRAGANMKELTYSTTVTIGYDAPWRLIHEMLLEAARRTVNVAQDTQPSVTQRALSDFYVEYTLWVLMIDPSRRRDTLSRLHANIQDTFNENGVQIMSPHYIGDPDQPKVVSPSLANPGIASTIKKQ
jgi:small-conductance mechanosensitive channel